MRYKILVTFVSVALLVNTVAFAANQSSSSSESEMSDGQAAGLLAGLVLIGGLLSLHGQSVEKAKAEATQQATKTLELRPGHTYIWSATPHPRLSMWKAVIPPNSTKQWQNLPMGWQIQITA